MAERCTVGSPIEETVAYAEGALPPGEAALIAAHLSGCAVCRERLATFAEVDGILRATYPPPDAPERRAAILAQLAAERPGRRG